MTDTYELVNFMKWLQSKGIKFEIPLYQKVMSGMYLKEDKFYELCDNYLHNTDIDDFEEMQKNFQNYVERVKTLIHCINKGYQNTEFYTYVFDDVCMLTDQFFEEFSE